MRYLIQIAIGIFTPMLLAWNADIVFQKMMLNERMSDATHIVEHFIPYVNSKKTGFSEEYTRIYTTHDTSITNIVIMVDGEVKKSFYPDTTYAGKNQFLSSDSIVVTKKFKNSAISIYYDLSLQKKFFGQLIAFSTLTILGAYILIGASTFFKSKADYKIKTKSR